MNGPLQIDDKGWRIPREGTTARKVYEMMRDGLGCTEIARRLGKPRNTIGVLMHRIRNGRLSRRLPAIYALRRHSVYVRKLVDILGMP